MVEAVIKLQRDNGDRTNRRRARLKYVVDDRGLPWVRETLTAYYGRPFEDARPMKLEVPDLLGWHEQGDGKLWLGIPVAAGRIVDGGHTQRCGNRLRTALRQIGERFAPNYIMTPQQDVILSDIAPAHRPAIDALLAEHHVATAETLSPMAQYALSCPALPTCGLALTEAERMHPEIVGGIDALLALHNLQDRRISVRITGCPERLRAHLRRRHRHRRPHARLLRHLRGRRLRRHAPQLQAAREGGACRGDQHVRSVVRCLGCKWNSWRRVWGFLQPGGAGGRGWIVTRGEVGGVRQASGSFLKKRTKKLLSPSGVPW